MKGRDQAGPLGQVIGMGQNPERVGCGPEAQCQEQVHPTGAGGALGRRDTFLLCLHFHCRRLGLHPVGTKLGVMTEHGARNSAVRLGPWGLGMWLRAPSRSSPPDLPPGRALRAGVQMSVRGQGARLNSGPHLGLLFLGACRPTCSVERGGLAQRGCGARSTSAGVQTEGPAGARGWLTGCLPFSLSQVWPCLSTGGALVMPALFCGVTAGRGGAANPAHCPRRSGFHADFCLQPLLV